MILVRLRRPVCYDMKILLRVRYLLAFASSGAERQIGITEAHSGGLYTLKSNRTPSAYVLTVCYLRRGEAEYEAA